MFAAVSSKQIAAFFRLSSSGSLFSNIEKAAMTFSNGKGGKSSAKLPQIAITGTPSGVLFATPIGALPA